MKQYLYKGDKNAYKANLHCHTTVSDGKYTPEQTKAMYQAEGYSIIAFTEHDALVSQACLNDDNFLAINACEVSVTQDINYTRCKTYHLNLYATDPNVTQTPPLPHMAYDDIDAINQYIQNRTIEGFLVCYNHPYWSLQTYDDYEKLQGCWAMEIYNHSGEIEAYNGYNPQSYDEKLRTSNNIFCVSTDDNHNIHPLYSANCDSFGGWVVVNSESLQYQDVITALSDGDFYASQGPEIYEVYVQDDKLIVKCSAVVLIAVYTQGRVCYTRKGAKLNHAEFDLTGHEGYVRVMCRDSHHKDANTNALWL
ncbi:MAG: PHP domain-containing protein [Oscillospiraceae bacterium]|nr:PHP domain-containing protein [Oscillospiraceae bacterium]